MTPEDFAAATGINADRLDRFRTYAALLAKWQKAINLVGPKTLPELWRRHFWDSAQLWPLVPAGARVFVDLGSGAGFPGLVLALLGAPEMHLIESDAKKATFLSEVIRATGVPATVHRARAETVTGIAADVVSARALAPLTMLLGLAAPFCHDATILLLPKGQDVENELTEAAKSWKIAPARVPSRSDPGATILRLTGRPVAASGGDARQT